MTPRRHKRTILVLGYGNPARGDDGAGPVIAQAIGQAHLPLVTTEVSTQLGIEHAAAIAAHDRVVMVDASENGPEPTSFLRVDPDPAAGFSSHCVTPGTLVYLARDLFASHAEVYLLTVRGYDFGYGKALSPGVRKNIEAARLFLGDVLAGGVPA